MGVAIEQWDSETAARRLRRRRRSRIFVIGVVVIGVTSIIADQLLVVRGSSGDDWARFDGRPVRIVRIIDGETLAVQEPQAEEVTTIRLLGIKAFHEEWDARTAEALDAELAGQALVLHVASGQSRDDRNRLLADALMADGSALSAHLAGEGMAVADRNSKSAFTAAIEKAQGQARRKQLGMWREK